MVTQIHTPKVSETHVTCSQAAYILGVHPEVVGSMVRVGRLPGEKVANRWLIPTVFVEEMAKTYVPKRGHPRVKRKYTKRSPKWFKQ